MKPDEIYLIEPYVYGNGTKRKKHWMEIADEEALYFKMVQEAIQQQNVQNAIAAGQTGASGVPEYRYFMPNMALSYSVSPATADGPLTVTFTNQSHEDINRYGTFSLVFGDGTTSSDPNTTHLYMNTGSYTVGISASAIFNNRSVASLPLVISASKPTVVAGFTFTTSSKTGKCTASFTSTSTVSSQTPYALYKVYFGDTNSASFAVTGSTLNINYIDNNTTIPAPGLATHNYFVSGSITASVHITSSYRNIASNFTRSWYQP